MFLDPDDPNLDGVPILTNTNSTIVIAAALHPVNATSGKLDLYNLSSIEPPCPQCTFSSPLPVDQNMTIYGVEPGMIYNLSFTSVKFWPTSTNCSEKESVKTYTIYSVCTG